MSSKRQILSLLTRPELQAIAETYELEVAGRRVVDQLVHAAVRSRKGQDRPLGRRSARLASSDAKVKWEAVKVLR